MMPQIAPGIPYNQQVAIEMIPNTNTADAFGTLLLW
jgi:hypothetical protein